MVNKALLAKRVLYGIARECDFEALGKDEVLAIKSDNGAMHHRFIERDVKELGEREFEHYASTEHVDGMGDIIKANGWDLLRLKTGRVPLFWGHNSEPVPMGLVTGGKRSKCPDGKRALVTRSSVYEPELYGDSEWGKHVASIVTLMQRGDMPGCSVGFIPKSARWPEKDERDELGMGQYGVIFEEQELYELSITPIPCNPYANETKELDRVKSALVEMVKSKQIGSDEAEWLQRALVRGESEFERMATQRTLVPMPLDVPWARGGKPAEKSVPPALPERGEPVLRALIREEAGAVSQAGFAALDARMVRIEEHLVALRGAKGITQPDSKTDKNRGVTEGREEHCPPTERTTGTSRAADPTAFARAVLEGAIGTVTASKDPNRHGTLRTPAQGAGNEAPR